MLLPPGPLTTLIAPPQSRGVGTGAGAGKVGTLQASGQLTALAGAGFTVTTATGPRALTFAPAVRFQPLDRAAAEAGLKPGDYVAAYGPGPKRIRDLVFGTQPFTARPIPPATRG